VLTVRLGGLRVAGWLRGPMRCAAICSFVQPPADFDGKFLRRFAFNNGSYAGQCFLCKTLTHGLFRAEHRRVNRAYAVRCPIGSVVVKYGTTVTNLLAIEQRFVAFNRINDIEYRNIGRSFGQSIPTAHPFRGLDDARLLQFWENLGNKRGRDALQFRKISTAGLSAPWIDQPKKAVDTVFNAISYVCHNTDNTTPGYGMQINDFLNCFPRRPSSGDCSTPGPATPAERAIRLLRLLAYLTIGLSPTK